MRNLEEELALVAEMPITFNAFVIEYTTRCNAKCGMCYQAAGPKGSDLIGRASLDVETAERAVRDAIGIETVAPRCHITGGEGFLQADILLRLVAAARDAGFLELTTTTNGFWARDPAQALAMARRARQSGMTGIEISWDAWHEPFVTGATVSNCIEACVENGIEANLRVLGTRSHTYEAALATLRMPAVELAARVTCAPVMPTGRAAAQVPIEDVPMQGTLDDSCHTMLNLTVNALGNVSPCCSGLDQVSTELFGNVRDRPLGEIVERMGESLLARVLVFRGVGVLADMLREAGAPVAGTFTGICHQCWSMLKDPSMVHAIEAALQQRRLLGLQRVVDAMRQPVHAG